MPPDGITEKLSFPDREIFRLSSDGGWAMRIQTIITQVTGNLPIISMAPLNDLPGFMDTEPSRKIPANKSSVQL
ncbi:MAG: hypothetical protein LUF85_13510 [Bacteroides sp.]|nr:hypothetical protein [Bacteroides sp.]